MREEFVEGVGLVRMTKNGRAQRNYNFRLKPDGSVFVSIPPGGSYRKALSLVKGMSDKIAQKQKHYNEKKIEPVLYDANTVIQGRLLNTRILKVPGFTSFMENDSSEVAVCIAENLDVYSEEAQEFIKKCLVEVRRFEAKTIIPPRVETLAREHEFSYKQVKINAAKTRWGSCSSVDNLNFSLFLMNVPEELCDYVILHELCHTIHKNHSPKFHALLNKVTQGQHAELNEKLKQYRPGF